MSINLIAERVNRDLIIDISERDERGQKHTHKSNNMTFTLALLEISPEVLLKHF